MEPEIGRLQLSWLGTPVISHGDQLVTFRTRKALALLIYLTAEGGIHTRQKLATLFWPESDTARGRGMLRTTLALLRQGLDTIETPTLIVERRALSFNFECDFELDLHVIQAALNLIEAQPDPAERGQMISQLQLAANHYRGDFLEGFSLGDTPVFDEWASLQREIWHGRMNQIFDALSLWQFEDGDLAAGLETATRWRTHGLFGEAAPQRLMQLHSADGNRAAALQVYEAYSQMLTTEFGGKPAPAIEALAAHIRASKPGQQARQRAILNRGETLTSMDLRFVGRTEEFKVLRTAYDAASMGETQLVILIGEAGIGKTRLAVEFLQVATAQGADVLTGRAFEAGGELPYQPLAQLLRHWLDQETAPADLLSETWLAELSRLLPELRDRYPELPQPQPDEATARGRLLEAITRLGQALAERAPLLLFIDDIQWADLPTLDALYYTASRWAEHKARILLLLCARDTALVEKANLQQWFTNLKTILPVSQLALSSLTAEDTLALVSSLNVGQPKASQTIMVAGEKLSPANILPPRQFEGFESEAFARALFTETTGQPLYLVETIKALLEQQVLIPYYTDEGIQRLQWRTLAGEPTGHFPLPQIIPNSIREAILDRLSRLTPAAATMLTATAVLGQAVSFRQLSEMSGIDEMAAVDALEELVARHLLLESSQDTPVYLISHDKIRDVLYDETSAARKQLLHRHAVTALQGGNPARLAYHALAAGMNEEAFHYSVMAGAAALHLFAADDAAAHYETARNLMATGQIAQVEDTDCQRLYTSLGRALELDGQFEQAGEIYKELESVAGQRAAPALKLAALIAQATLGFMFSPMFDPVQGEALAEEALDLARALGDPAAEAKILWSLMNFHIPANRLAQALACGEQALTLAREFKLQEQQAFILNDIAKCYRHLGHLDRAGEVLQEARELWQVLNNLPMLADSLSGLAACASLVGNYDSALAFSEEAFQISQAIANGWGQAYSSLSAGKIYWERGQLDKAMAVMKECLRLAEMDNYLAFQIITRADLGTVRAECCGLFF